MRAYGMCGRAGGVGGRGIDLPGVDLVGGGADVAVTPVADRPAGPVRCPVCGLVVTAEYRARTGRDRHGPCQRSGLVAWSSARVVA